MRRDDRQRRPDRRAPRSPAPAPRRRCGPHAAPRGSSARETFHPVGGEALGRGGVALQQRLPDVAVARAGQRDDAVGPVVEPRAVELRTAAMLMRAIGARKPVAQPQVAFARCGKQQHARRLVALAVVGDPDVAAGDRLHAPRARRRIELDEAELVGEIGERKRRHSVRCRCAHGVVDAQRSVRDRKLAVQTQVDEAGR